MSLRHYTSGDSRPWSFARRPQDASLRRQIHGPVQGMDWRPGLLSRIFEALCRAGRRG